jgi:hypothetical protein
MSTHMEFELGLAALHDRESLGGSSPEFPLAMVVAEVLESIHARLIDVESHLPPADAQSLTAAVEIIEARGFRVVPVEPTLKMVAEGVIEDAERYAGSTPIRDIWTAMVAAAPELARGVGT